MSPHVAMHGAMIGSSLFKGSAVTIKCTLIYKGSDSLQQTVELQCVPRVGDLLFISEQLSIVDSILHVINPNANEHEVRVIYKPAP